MRDSRKSLRIARSAPAAPIYRQIKQLVLRKITQGDWRVGAQVPTEQDLVNMLGVSRMTVCRALNELTTEGILTRKSGVGTFVAKTPAPRSLIELRDIGEIIAERGQRHSRKVLGLERREVTEFLSERLQLPFGTRIFYSHILHVADDEPVQLEERWVNPQQAPGYIDQDFEHLSPLLYLSGCGQPTEANQAIHAANPKAAEASLLRIAHDAPCFLILKRLWIDKTVLCYERLLSPGSRLSLSGRYRYPH